jgi:hypothetical protein
MAGAGFGPEYLELMIIDIEMDQTTGTVLYLEVGDNGIWKGQSFGRSGQRMREIQLLNPSWSCLNSPI